MKLNIENLRALMFGGMGIAFGGAASGLLLSLVAPTAPNAILLEVVFGGVLVAGLAGRQLKNRGPDR